MLQAMSFTHYGLVGAKFTDCATYCENVTHAEIVAQSEYVQGECRETWSVLPTLQPHRPESNRLLGQIEQQDLSLFTSLDHNVSLIAELERIARI